MVGFALSIVIAMRVLCVTLLLWGCVQGIKVHKDLTVETDASATVVAEIFNTFKKVHGKMPEGYSLNAKAFADPAASFHIPWEKIKSLAMPDTIRDVVMRRGSTTDSWTKVTGTDQRDLRKYLTCSCPIFMYGWVVVAKKDIGPHLTECQSVEYTKTWHTEEATSGLGRRATKTTTLKRGADAILADVPWTDLNTQMIKVFGEPVPRMINNQAKLREIINRADSDFFTNNPKYDFLILRWLIPYMVCSAGQYQSCLALSSKIEGYIKDQDGYPESLTPYISGLKTELMME